MNRNENVKGVTKRKNKKLLVSVNVLGSVGPIRFLANEDDEVSSAINTTLKAYARQGRIPVLGFDVDNFIFYSINAGFNTLHPQEKIGSMDVTNFLMCKKEPRPLEKVEGIRESRARIGHGWKTTHLLRFLLGYIPYNHKPNSTSQKDYRSFGDGNAYCIEEYQQEFQRITKIKEYQREFQRF
uniref:DUF7054 domain-containing protein n=1 Tax=Arabidopsis thaliana TaxID=3702 RepID=Q8LEI3_ARATH|nr:unknown [Arabidopsis thaliana]